MTCRGRHQAKAEGVVLDATGDADLGCLGGATETVASMNVASDGVPTVSGVVVIGFGSGCSAMGSCAASTICAAGFGIDPGAISVGPGVAGALTSIGICPSGAAGSAGLTDSAGALTWISSGSTGAVPVSERVWLLAASRPTLSAPAAIATRSPRRNRLRFAVVCLNEA